MSRSNMSNLYNAAVEGGVNLNQITYELILAEAVARGQHNYYMRSGQEEKRVQVAQATSMLSKAFALLTSVNNGLTQDTRAEEVGSHLYRVAAGGMIEAPVASTYLSTAEVMLLGYIHSDLVDAGDIRELSNARLCICAAQATLQGDSSLLTELGALAEVG